MVLIGWTDFREQHNSREPMNDKPGQVGYMSVSESETRASRALRAMLADLSDGASLAESEPEQLRRFLSGLECFLSEVLAEVHSEWRDQKTRSGEALDGILPLAVRKTGKREAELLGVCYLLTDNARATVVVPLHVGLQISPTDDRIMWLECRLGERAHHGMVRIRYNDINVVPKHLYLLDGHLDRINWFYHVAYGQRT
jgi:hypothetical protein